MSIQRWSGTRRKLQTCCRLTSPGHQSPSALYLTHTILGSNLVSNLSNIAVLFLVENVRLGRAFDFRESLSPAFCFLGKTGDEDELLLCVRFWLLAFICWIIREYVFTFANPCVRQEFPNYRVQVIINDSWRVDKWTHWTGIPKHTPIS